MKKKVVYIVGPTGVGKTDLAYEIAQKFDGALVSADSVQVYKGLNVISGKDLPKDSKFSDLPNVKINGIRAGYYSYNSVRIFLLDVVEPTFQFSVNNFYHLASHVLELLSHDNTLPIVVGGTGLYVQTLMNGLDTSTKPDYKLREELSKLSVEELKKRVPREKLSTMNDSDRKNSRRLIRAIEIGERAENKFEGKKSEAMFENLIIGLECSREELKKRIDIRVKRRIEDGALNEAEKLFKNYKNLSPQVKNANGYKQLFAFLKGEYDFNEALFRWKISEYRHAKNQMTWFKKYGNVEWFNVEKEKNKEQIVKKIEMFVSNLGG